MAEIHAQQRQERWSHVRRMARAASLLAAAVVVGLTAGTARAAPDRSAALIMDYSTGATLYAHNADEPRHPASLTKMMTLYMTFEAIQQGRLTMDQKLLVSQFAFEQEPTKLGLRPGTTIPVRDAVLGLVTKSANDAAVVLAENLAGSEPAFARQMTQRARRLGMGSTLFTNASGLPSDAQITTARDMAILGRALIRDFPDFYALFSTRSFTYQGRQHPNHNRLMNVYDGMDGIKTGFIRASGFNLVASAKRDGRRLVGSVFGGASPSLRDQQMARLLDAGFAGTLTASAADLAPKRTQLAIADDPKPALTPVSTRLPARPMGGATITPVSATLGRAAGASVEAAHPQAAPDKSSLKPAAAKVPAPAAKARGTWAVQVGAFATPTSARKAAEAASARARGPLADGTVAVAEGKDAKGAKLYRARIAGLTEKDARDACQALARQNSACVAVPAG